MRSMATKPCPKCGGGPLWYSNRASSNWANEWYVWCEACGNDDEDDESKRVYLDDHMTITEALRLVGQSIEDADEELIQGKDDADEGSTDCSSDTANG